MGFGTIMLFSFMSNPLYGAFGGLLKILYDFFGSYGLAMIFLTLIIHGIMIPFQARGQKGMIKQQEMASKQSEIKRKYPNDKQKQQEEIQKLYAGGGMGGMFGGCLFQIIPLFLMWPLFRIVQAPYIYLTNISADSLTKIGEFLLDKGLITENVANIAARTPIPVITALEKNGAALQEAVSQGLIKMSQLIDMDFLGMDLSVRPSFNPSVIFGPDKNIYLPLLMIPLAYLITTVVQMRMTTVMKPNYKEEKEAKARAKANPARAEQVPQAGPEGSMKAMMWMMPVLSLSFVFLQPAALGVYLIFGGIIRIIQQIIMYYLYTKPLEEKKREMAQLKQLALTKGINTAEQVAKEKLESKKKKKKNIETEPAEKETPWKEPTVYKRQKRNK